jgi:hypothetical protein
MNFSGNFESSRLETSTCNVDYFFFLPPPFIGMDFADGAIKAPGK